MHSERNFSVSIDDLNQLELLLRGSPIYEYLDVFIQDPKNSKQYWFRKIRVKGRAEEKSNNITPVILDLIDAGELYNIPWQEGLLDRGIELLCKFEESAVNNGETRNTAAIGIAIYHGEKDLALDHIISIVGLKYHQARMDFYN